MKLASLTINVETEIKSLTLYVKSLLEEITYVAFSKTFLACHEKEISDGDDQKLYLLGELYKAIAEAGSGDMIIACGVKIKDIRIDWNRSGDNVITYVLDR